MANANSHSAINLIIEADIVVQMVIIFLLIASLVSWAIIFDKILKFRLLKKEVMLLKNILMEVVD